MAKKRKFILLGDKTTHGGTVVSAWGAGFQTIDDIPVACIGDMVSCPKKGHGTNPIIKGATGPDVSCNGRVIAREGDTTACGSQLIASQAIATHSSESEDAAEMAAIAARAQKEEQVTKGIQTASSTPGISAEEAKLLKEQQKEEKVYKLQFKVVDTETGNPIGNRSYSIKREKGPNTSGLTDSKGMTEVIESDKPESIEIGVDFRAPAKEFTRYLLLTGDMSDLKKSEFVTKTDLVESTKEGRPNSYDIKIDDRAATRQAIITKVRDSGYKFTTRSDWGAKPTKAASDWEYHSIVIHHAGNSYSCSADGSVLLKKAEATDIQSFGQISYHYAVDCAGNIYEALDVRNKGAHLEKANTGAIGIVFLTDLSKPGESVYYGPKYSEVEGIGRKIKEILGDINDMTSDPVEEPPALQVEAALALVGILKDFFNIKKLGGHREFAVALGNPSRACPGYYGLKIAEQMRSVYGISTP